MALASMTLRAAPRPRRVVGPAVGVPGPSSAGQMSMARATCGRARAAPPARPAGRPPPAPWPPRSPGRRRPRGAQGLEHHEARRRGRRGSWRSGGRPAAQGADPRVGVAGPHQLAHALGRQAHVDRQVRRAAGPCALLLVEEVDRAWCRRRPGGPRGRAPRTRWPTSVRASQPPRGITRRKPRSSTWVTISPISSMWAASISRVPPPSRTPTTPPSGSSSTRSQSASQLGLGRRPAPAPRGPGGPGASARAVSRARFTAGQTTGGRARGGPGRRPRGGRRPRPAAMRASSAASAPPAPRSRRAGWAALSSCPPSRASARRASPTSRALRTSWRRASTRRAAPRRAARDAGRPARDAGGAACAEVADGLRGDGRGPAPLGPGGAASASSAMRAPGGGPEAGQAHAPGPSASSSPASTSAPMAWCASSARASRAARAAQPRPPASSADPPGGARARGLVQRRRAPGSVLDGRPPGASTARVGSAGPAAGPAPDLAARGRQRPGERARGPIRRLESTSLPKWSPASSRAWAAATSASGRTLSMTGAQSLGPTAASRPAKSRGAAHGGAEQRDLAHGHRPDRRARPCRRRCRRRPPTRPPGRRRRCCRPRSSRPSRRPRRRRGRPRAPLAARRPVARGVVDAAAAPSSTARAIFSSEEEVTSTRQPAARARCRAMVATPPPMPMMSTVSPGRIRARLTSAR